MIANTISLLRDAVSCALKIANDLSTIPGPLIDKLEDMQECCGKLYDSDINNETLINIKLISNEIGVPEALCEDDLDNIAKLQNEVAYIVYYAQELTSAV